MGTDRSLLDLRSLELLAALQWKFVLRISCPCPWFRPQSSTANLFGFNQSSPWLLIFFFMPSVSYSFFLRCVLENSTLYLFPSLSSYLSTCLFFRGVRSISMLMLWHVYGNVWHVSYADPYIRQSFRNFTFQSSTDSAFKRGYKRTTFPRLNLTGPDEEAINVMKAMSNNNFTDSWAEEHEGIIH